MSMSKKWVCIKRKNNISFWKLMILSNWFSVFHSFFFGSLKYILKMAMTIFDACRQGDNRYVRQFLENIENDLNDVGILGVENYWGIHQSFPIQSLWSPHFYIREFIDLMNHLWWNPFRILEPFGLSMYF